MYMMTLNQCPGHEGWREAARWCLHHDIPPEQVYWQLNPLLTMATGPSLLRDSQEALPLFAAGSGGTPLPSDTLWSVVYHGATSGQEPLTHQAQVEAFSLPSQDMCVPRGFMSLASQALYHRDPARFHLVYRLLWRIVQERKSTPPKKRRILQDTLDDDMRKIQRMIREVRRDAYKIKAFLRFRGLETPLVLSGKDGDNTGDGSLPPQTIEFMAWYEPYHYSLELALPFFTQRFRNMTWAILTPYMGAYWDGRTLIRVDNPDPSLIPEHDDVEAYWLQYYASIFNPARLKVKAMTSSMPKKYWKNMPETALIPNLIEQAQSRTQQMILGNGES